MSSQTAFSNARLTARMEAVQDPVIPIVASLIAQHPGTISLGQGVVHYPPPPEVKDGIEQFLANPQNHKYQPVYGIPELREQIEVKLAHENKVQLGDSYSLFVTAGGNQAFVNVVDAICDTGDEVILMTPYYFNFEMAVIIAGGQPVLVPTTSNYQLDLDAIGKAITSRTKAIVTISPNNPTGAVYPESDLRAVNELCAKHGLYHVHDEVYEYFVYGDTPHFSPASLQGAGEHTVTIHSLSKAYGFASWRIGYLIVPKHLEYSITKVQDTVLVCPPVVSQWAAAAVLKQGSDYCREKISQFAEVRDRAFQELQRIASICEAPATEGAFYVFPKLQCDMKPLELIRQLVREHGVAAMPGTAFGMHDGCYVRLSYGALQAETVVEGIQRFVKGVEAIIS